MLAPRTIHAHSENFLLKKQTKHFISSQHTQEGLGCFQGLGMGVE